MEDRRFPSVDAVTGLSQRRDLLDRFDEERVLVRTLRNRRNLAAMMVDIDGFKRVNDSCGHVVGDAMLRDVATIIRTVVRPSDVVARYGGDEFAVLFLPQIQVADAEQLAERLRVTVQEHPLPDVTSRPIMHHAFPEKAHVSHIAVSVGIGITFLLPWDESAELFARAGAAMDDVKRHGGNDVCTYDGRFFRPYGQPGP
jgi:diguanylate cyclase (GGDEF)-like protein